MRLIFSTALCLSAWFISVETKAQTNESMSTQSFQERIIPIETLSFSNGEEISTYIDPEKSEIVGIHKNGEILRGKELRAFRKNNEILSENYLSTRTAKPIDCDGCEEKIVTSFNEDVPEYREALRNGVTVKRTDYGTDFLEGLVIKEWSEQETKAYSYDVDEIGKVTSVDVTYDSRAAGIYRTERLIKDENGQWRADKAGFFTPIKKNNSGFINQSYSNNSFPGGSNPPIPSGCDSYGCWTTGTIGSSSACASGWSCGGYVENGNNGSTIDYQYQ